MTLFLLTMVSDRGIGRQTSYTDDTLHTYTWQENHWRKSGYCYQETEFADTQKNLKAYWLSWVVVSTTGTMRIFNAAILNLIMFCGARRC